MKCEYLKRLAGGLMALTMAVSLGACSGNKPDPTASPSQKPADEKFTVGVCQLAPHAALDAATKGFEDALKEAFGDRVEVIVNNAAGEAPTCATIVNGFVASEVDLIMANATPALQAAASATGDIPILGTSVTEYGVALGIENFSGVVGSNVSGTSDLAPLDQQAAMVKEWFPEAKKVGLVFCSAEPNSQYQVDVVKAELDKLGFTTELFPFSDSNDMVSVTQTACSFSDVIYVPTDNTVANNTGVVDNICRPAKVPVICGEESTCAGCGVATLSISYYDLGVATGKMAVKVLNGEVKISELPIGYAPETTRKYNAAICADLNLTVPDGYEAIETK